MEKQKWTLKKWDSVSFHRPEEAEFDLVMPLFRSKKGGSGAFLGRLSNDSYWWIKPTGLQGDRVSVNEFIVGKIGQLFGAPVPSVTTVHVGEGMASRGWEYRQGRKLEAGIFSATSHIGASPNGSQPAEGGESKTFTLRERDRNRERHVGYLALHDLCWDTDPQWFYDATDDMACYSHDHGHFLTGSPTWSRQSLLQRVQEPHVFRTNKSGLDADMIDSMAGRLQNLEHAEVAKVLQMTPATWPISNDELSALGYFICERAPGVAARLEEMKP